LRQGAPSVTPSATPERTRHRPTGSAHKALAAWKILSRHIAAPPCQASTIKLMAGEHNAWAPTGTGSGKSLASCLANWVKLHAAMMTDRNKATQELLAFYQEAGVDALLDETPINRFAEPTPPQPNAAPIAEMRAPVAPSVSPPANPAALSSSARPARDAPFTPPAPEAAVMAARTAARSAPDLETLRQILDRFEGCGLRATASRLVFADGDPSARVMLIGEAPGREEDLEGRPFVGRSGKLLDRMLAAIGLDRSSVYIANIVPWRPPGNRTPTPQETAICLPFILRQIELVDPDILVCLGNPSTQTLLSTKDGITKTRGRWFTFNAGSREVRAIPTYHPAFLLRSPLQKRFAWRDFLAVKKALTAATAKA
jgi:DNA polymerase